MTAPALTTELRLPADQLELLADLLAARLTAALPKPQPTAQALLAAAPYLSVKDAAQVADIDEKTIRRAIDSGDLKAGKAGRQIRITPEDLQDWMRRKGA